ncbi:SMP-30/gluconolactonase/LRE family protein [Celeribacter litoreus]|uniref:SMP-30/gluconolactonase/LRE family protein n=1 Tax=Celeribacter litoreus TaxID=2876714 RepID=UPI001CCC20DF|nr:SMP-30/gluconolactonase/LRE family protein [Celeribacter litoreus]MCA0044855.1 SMP-30/gluconolactonase/LRE family protein [Celeribacter litoreus]
MSAELFDNRSCFLGEGPLWHPDLETLFWFDIINKKLLSRGPDGAGEWSFDECHSAAGIVDAQTLLIASETGLWRFDIGSGTRELIVSLEADRPETRSNDGRTDPFGGFWVGTMGKSAEAGLGSIYRYFKGELRQLHSGLTIPNAICFSPDGRYAYFACTDAQKINRQPLDRDGWPAGPAETFIDLSKHDLNPDGAIVDAEGGIWNAQWGAGRVARYLPDGTFDRAIAFPADHCSCPAFGGSDMKTLFVTSAREGLTNPKLAQGCVYSVIVDVRGGDSVRVKL